jgi:hypothetical protein
MEDGRIRVRPVFAVLIAASIVGTVALCFYPQPREVPAVPPRPASTTAGHEARRRIASVDVGGWKSASAAPASARTAPSTNAVDRLQEIRERFRALAAGDPAVALRAAKEISNETERKAALFALLDALKHGDVAKAADGSGQSGQELENNLGIALAQSDPALAVVWANELADAAGRTTILEFAAITLLKSDPAAAMALSQQVAESDRAAFYQALFSGWATYNTQAAFDAAGAMDDPDDRDTALQSIQSVAPVGIGALLSMDNGYPVVAGLMPGAAADLSGQLAVGDRIIAVSQGDGDFESVQGMSLNQIVGQVRGPVGTVVELAIIPANADPGSEPEYVAIPRGQILFQP